MAEGSAREHERDAVVRSAARASEPDRYLAALLAPRQARAGLIALAAFLGEVARIPVLVREPMMGEIRLQWWRDVIAETRAAGATGSPVADALLVAIERHALPRDLFIAILEARSRELDPDFPATEQDLEDHLRDTEGAAFRLAARVLGAGESAATDELLNAAGQCYGRVCLLRALASSVAQGRSPLPVPRCSQPHPPIRIGRRTPPRYCVRREPGSKPFARVFPPHRRPCLRRFCRLPSLSPIWRLWRGLVPTSPERGRTSLR